MSSQRTQPARSSGPERNRKPPLPFLQQRAGALRSPGPTLRPQAKGKTMREFIAPTLLFVGSHLVILFVAMQMYALGQ